MIDKATGGFYFPLFHITICILEAPFAVEMDSNEDNGIEKEFLEIEDIEDDEETEQPSSNIIEMRQLDALTGAPFAEDTLLYALPVCGPYDALLPYKYKVPNLSVLVQIQFCR